LESEWSTHKKIIEIKKDKGGIRKQIPKSIFLINPVKIIDFAYFYVDFNTSFGYAHVIEKAEKYNKAFAHVK
jgi:hypothetical protein